MSGRGPDRNASNQLAYSKVGFDQTGVDTRALGAHAHEVIPAWRKSLISYRSRARKKITLAGQPSEKSE